MCAFNLFGLGFLSVLISDQFYGFLYIVIRNV